MLKRNNNIIERNIHNSYFLINIRQNYLNDKCVLFELNEMGHFIWNALEGEADVHTIVNRILREIDEPIDRDDITNDVRDYLFALREEGFIEFDERD